jgi:integral membrane protein
MNDGLRWAAMAEAVTLLALVFVAVPLKHVAGFDLATRIIGPVHGLTFLMFSWFIVRAWSEGVIDWKAAMRLFIGAMIPFGGFINERWLRRNTSTMAH